MIYYTGDPHGSKHEISRFCNRMRLTEQDTIVVLGDVGANYFGDERDGELKRAFRRLKPTIFCIHGNHEMRPASHIRKKNGVAGRFGTKRSIRISSLPETVTSSPLRD